ncbi:MAG: hypothetical protein H0V93_08355 [Euzebyales bacterium]|nr:hypothetical protein [Euzebyales bacterium]
MPAAHPARRAVAWCALALLALAAAASPAMAAQPDADRAVAELGLRVEAGYDGRHAGGAWLPVEVRLDPARALAARLTVRSRSVSGVQQVLREVEATARTPRVYRLLVPSGSVSVILEEPDREPVEVRAQVERGGPGFVVGVLGAAPQGAPALRAEAPGLDGAWVGVDPAFVELSPAALEPLDALVVDAASMAELSDDGRRNLAAGVTAGTDLVAVSDVELPAAIASPVTTPGTLEPVEGAWTMTAAQAGLEGDEVVAVAGAAGRGRVVAVADAPGSGLAGGAAEFWGAVTGPGGRTAATSEWAVDRVPYQFVRLLADGGGAVPGLPWLAVFTIAYVLVVGPVNGLVLARMRRRELAWVTVPLVTVVFTAGALAGVSGSRPPGGVTASATVWIDGVGVDHDIVMARAPSEGERTVTLPGADWTVTTVADGGREATVATADGQTRATLDLAALQPGGVVATRAVDTPPPLTLDVAAGPDGVSATVTNAGGDPVEDVIVRAATASARVGTLLPGQSGTVELGGESLPVANPYRDAFEGLRQDGPATLEALVRAGPMDGGPGLVWALGTRPASGNGARVETEPAVDRGRLIAVARRPAPAAAVSAFAVDRLAIADGGQVFRPSPNAVENATEAFLRFRLPPGTDPDAVRADLDRGDGQGAIELTVWDPAARRWVPVADGLPDGGPPTAIGPLGEVWVRATGELYPFEFSGRGLRATGAEEAA